MKCFCKRSELGVWKLYSVEKYPNRFFKNTCKSIGFSTMVNNIEQFCRSLKLKRGGERSGRVNISLRVSRKEENLVLHFLKTMVPRFF